MMNDIRVFESKQILAEHFGRVILDRMSKADKLTIGLSGGSTPKAIFDELATKYADIIDWSKLYIFWGDERCVAPDDDESNYCMTRKHLLDKIDIPVENVFRIKGELNASDALSDYKQILKSELPMQNGLPLFDLMILGMGEDGHTASIFPYQIQLWDEKELCVVAQHPETKQKRISLTGDVINNAKEKFFLVTGSSKVDKIDEILHQKEGCDKYPAALVKDPVWLLDGAAASKLYL